MYVPAVSAQESRGKWPCVFCLPQESKDWTGVEPCHPRNKYQARKSRGQSLGRTGNRAVSTGRFAYIVLNT